MKYKIIWSRDAKEDLLDIITYIKENTGSNTARVIYNKIQSKIEKIAQFPEGFRVVPELKEIGVNEIKELIESPWRIFYKTTESEIKILTIIDGRRNIEDILYKKMLEGKLT